MKLYFIPFACTLATRIAMIEAELDADFVPVTPGGTLPDGRPFTAVSPMGYVPAMETRGGLALSRGAGGADLYRRSRRRGRAGAGALYRRALSDDPVAQLRLDRNPQGACSRR